MVPGNGHIGTVRRKGIPPFSVMLLMAAAAVVGLASMRMLNVQYTPSAPDSSIRVGYRFSDASARIVESEVTSRIEGVLSGIDNCSGVSSVSRKGSGSVTVDFHKGTDMAAARFDVASRIRDLYPYLPDKVTYPSISLDVGGGESRTAITYVIKSSLPSGEIESYISEHVVTPLSRIPGVENAALYGATPYHWVITFDAERSRVLGITAEDISAAFHAYGSEEALGMVEDDGGMLTVRLKCNASGDFGQIPVKNIGGRVVYLRDIANYRYEEALPAGYYRINGLNTISLNVDVAANTNLIRAVKDIRREMSLLQEAFPEEITASVSYDSSEYVSNELDKIFFRTLLCLAVLLAFVFLVNRSLRYMLAIAATLAVNILVAIAIYGLVGLSVHIYTLAGISVSLGIVIDTSIVMIDHYGHFRDRKVFAALLGAVATTVGALLVVLLLPDSERENLTDFICVIVINLGVSLAVTWLFVPALADCFPIKRGGDSMSISRRRRVVKWNRAYKSYICWGLRHRWIYAVSFIAAFGIPLCLIPDKPSSDGAEPRNWLENICYKVSGWQPYADNRATIDKVAGSSFALFHRAMDRMNFYREPDRTVLTVHAGMLEGATVHQLNDVVRSMENYLAGFDEIDVFTTRVTSYSNAVIQVMFKPEYENTGFPLVLKSQVTSMAIDFGGANWRVSGIDDNYFNNNVVSTYKGSGILLRGYNYDELLGYAGRLIDRMSGNRRVSGPEIWSSGYNGQPSMEYNLSYDFESMGSRGISPYRYYSYLHTALFELPVGTADVDGTVSEVVLKSSDQESLDLWHVLNAPARLDMTLSSMGSIGKYRSGLDIRKVNQSYEVCVAYDFIGSWQLQQKMQKELVQWMNSEVLPVGFKAVSRDSRWSDEHRDSYLWLILLVIAVIYVVTAITFESFRLPLPVIFMIPVSFIGPFLVFGLSDITFDQGGFAAFVMLCGVVVNAGIYLVTAWQDICRSSGATTGRLQGEVRCYIKAYSRKINPIILTVLSTVLGLLPFLSDGPEEVFWFDFAVGTVSGMLFSVLAIVFVLPVFVVKKSVNH
ncbi:MAG: efflux RND transporter permease subunit [Clostridium sp.]|nr:efflux RND transporter permease subunit [Bacteroides sp.]MCM1197598.1 efflux RND transporter permease subunit [Clostridium sp.]